MRSSLPKTALIIPAAGSGERLGANLPKALVQLVGRTLIEHAVTNLSPIASEIIIAAPAGFEKTFKKLFGNSVKVVTGGATRTASVKLALAEVSDDVEFVLVHDAARALASSDLALRILDSLIAGERAVIPTLPVTDTIKRVDSEGYVTKTPNRAKLRAVQTPQGFRRKTLTLAHLQNIEGTDDASLVEELGIPVLSVEGETRALKITTPDDLAVAAKYLIESSDVDIRVGVGVDAHAFSENPNRPLFLAGLTWPNEIGLEGHSDSDVAAHAICDSLFSAAGLGDLGSNFGVDKPEYAGATGARLLGETVKILASANFEIKNVAVQIVGNKPKIGLRRSEAIAALSSALGGVKVSVTATTTDGLGFTGEGKGISAIATSLIARR